MKKLESKVTENQSQKATNKLENKVREKQSQKVTNKIDSKVTENRVRKRQETREQSDGKTIIGSSPQRFGGT